MDVTSLDDLQTREYWDQRYEQEGATTTYDWFKNWTELSSHLLPHIGQPPTPRILELGCGNSTLTPALHSLGFTNLTSLDFSATVISQMRDKHPEINWVEMDIRDMVERDGELGGKGSWDVVLDKGTLDALVAEKGSVWDPSERVRENARREIDAVLHLLRPGGRFLYLTWMSKPLRMPFLERPADWNIEVKNVNDGNGLDYYLYVCTKHAEASGEEQGGAATSPSS